MLSPNESLFLSITDYSSVLCKLELAWEHFISNGISYPYLPRSTILESWKRSKQRSVPFDQRKAFLELDSIQIAAEKERRQVFFETMSPYLQNIAKTFPDNYYIAVTFCDEKGIMLDCRCSKKVFEKFEEGNYIPGANWSESASGTNGIGTAIETGKPVQVFAAEHFCKEFQDWICSSAPIKETVSGVILGVLTITMQKDIIPIHSLNWVVSEARKIEKALQGRWIEDSSTLVNLLFDRAGQPGLIYNLSGEISRINSLAKKMLFAKPGDGLNVIFNISAKQSPFLHQFNKAFAVTCRPTGQRLIATTAPLAVGEYVVGGIAFFQNERAASKAIACSSMSPGTRYDFSSIIGGSATIRKTVQLAGKASQIDSTVLITGETGTGKEVIAQSIHNNSRRQGKTFLSVNCGAMPKELIATELFGYEEGAFTGALKAGKIGKFEAAEGGTLFLDEIGDMPLDVQVYLLRILEERSITRIGAHKPVPVDVRVICATNRDLQQEVELGRFRQDFFYRINGIEICLPPLRDRKEDIPLLAEHFLQRHYNNLTLAPDAVEKLLDYSWPGNVRELKNVIDRAAFLCAGIIITANDIHLPEKKQMSNSLRSKRASGKHVRDLPPEIISEVLKECHGNVSQAARRLQISRLTLYRKIKKYNLY